MRKYTTFWPAALIGTVVLLGGCTGEPRTFYTEKAIVLKPPAAVRAPARPAVARSAPAFSQAEKERLFRAFQQSQALKEQALQEQASPDKSEATP